MSVRHKSITADEEVHLQYGSRILKGDSNRLRSGTHNPDDSKMPFSALNAIPSAVSQFLPDGWLKRFSSTIQAGRPITILFSTSVAFLVYLWARDLYGSFAALLSLTLYCLDPNIIAHSQLVTTDVYAMGMMLLALYTFWRYNRDRTTSNLFISAAALGLSQLAKFSAIFLLPLFILIRLIHDSPGVIAWTRSPNVRDFYEYVRQFLSSLILFILISLIVINAGYLFNRTPTDFRDYSFQSSLFRNIQAKFSIIEQFPVPLPYPYLEGLDLVKYRDEVWYGYGRIYLLGELSTSGFPGYYFAAILLKTPLPTLIAITIGLIILFKQNFSLRKFLDNELFLIVPVVWFLYYMNFRLHAQLGIRLILPIFPLFFILAGNLLRCDAQSSRFRYGLNGFLILWLVVSLISYYPDYLAYFNELILDRRTTYRYLANSNLNWRQSQRYLEDWLVDHPEATVNPATPTSGLIIFDPNKLNGTPRNQVPDKYAWLRDNFDPIDIVAHTYPVFCIQDDDPILLRFNSSP
jgi:4-amino-4-deoxy-L-arabinose transferase-like glycosyltransferase